MTPAETTEHILQLLREHGEGDYLGEAVSQLQHCLQAAALVCGPDADTDTDTDSTSHATPAAKEGTAEGGERTASSPSSADGELVIAALLHDIGHFLPPSAAALVLCRDPAETLGAPGTPGTTTDAGPERRRHDRLGAAYLHRLNFSPRVCALVASHVEAKRYLCAVEPAYYASLSAASKDSLRAQGGPMRPAQAAAWQRQRWAADMVALRRCDDGAKVPGWDVAPLDRYAPLILRHLEARA